MKILHVITSLHTGGAEKLMVDLLPRFNQAGECCDLLLFDGSETPFKEMLRKAGVRLIETGRGGSVYHPKHLLRLIPHLRKYDIIHTHNTAPQLFVALAKRWAPNTKIVTTEHNTTNRRRHWPWYKPIDRWMYRQYDRIICISDQAFENLTTYLGKRDARIITIYNGADTAKYIAATPHQEFFFPERKVLMMVAGFRHQKDQATLIRAMQHLPERFHLYLVGDGEERAKCEALSKELGITSRCHFLGIRMDVPQLLKAADFIVMSSHWEGLSLASIEGMSVGKPFVASNVDGLREIVSGAGVLFPHEGDRELAEIILQLDNDPELYRRISEACLERARKFDIATMAENYLTLYKSL